MSNEKEQARIDKARAYQRATYERSQSPEGRRERTEARIRAAQRSQAEDTKSTQRAKLKAEQLARLKPVFEQGSETLARRLAQKLAGHTNLTEDELVSLIVSELNPFLRKE